MGDSSRKGEGRLEGEGTLEGDLTDGLVALVAI